MAFLVQTRFKNGFRDLRTQDVDFFENLDDAQPDYYDYAAESIHVTDPSQIEMITKDLETLGLVVEAREKGFTVAHVAERTIEQNADRTRLIVYGASAKVWRLEDKQNIGKATTLHYIDGHWLTEAEFDKTLSLFIEELGIEDESNELTFEKSLEGYREFKKALQKVETSNGFRIRPDREPKILYEFLTGKDFYRISTTEKQAKIEAEMREMLANL